MTDRFIDIAYNTEDGSIVAPRESVATITAITKANPGVVTAANNFVDGDLVSFAGCTGMPEMNGLTATVSSASSTGFTTDINTSGFSAAATAGTATLLSNITNTVRVLYDDTVCASRIVDSLQRAKDIIVRLLNA